MTDTIKRKTTTYFKTKTNIKNRHSNVSEVFPAFLFGSYTIAPQQRAERCQKNVNSKERVSVGKVNFVIEKITHFYFTQHD